LSSPIRTVLDVKPSLTIWQMRAVNYPLDQVAGADIPNVGPPEVLCERRQLPALRNGYQVALRLQAIGLPPASDYNPLTLSATFVDLEGQPQNISERLIAGDETELVLDVGQLPQETPESEVLVNLRSENRDGDKLARTFRLSVLQEYT